MHVSLLELKQVTTSADQSVCKSIETKASHHKCSLKPLQVQIKVYVSLLKLKQVSTSADQVHCKCRSKCMQIPLNQGKSPQMQLKATTSTDQSGCKPTYTKKSSQVWLKSTASADQVHHPTKARRFEALMLLYLAK